MFYLLNPYNKPASWFMVAASGTYAVSGQAARLLVQHGLVAAAGSYAVGGQQVNLFKGVNLFADSGHYDVTGIAVGLFRALRLPAAQGAYAVSGQLADFIRALRVAAGFGSYSVTGLAAGIFATRQMLVGRGDYVLAGQDVALRKTLNFPADQGSYTLSGQDVSFRRDLRLLAALGSYVLGGQDVQFNWNHPMAAAMGAYALSGQDVLFRRNFPVVAEQGAYGLSGQDVNLAYSAGYYLPADAGQYDVSGQAAGLFRGSLIPAAQGAYTVTGLDVGFTRQLSMAAAAGAFVLAGQGATLTYTQNFAVLTQKGYGHVYGASNTANLAMSYANVDGGSAPAAGDLVVWFVLSRRSSPSSSPNNDLTGSGWVQGNNYVTGFTGASILAKVLVSGDLSSPPTIVTSPQFGSLGFWVAYSFTGAINALAVSMINQQFSSASAPSNQVVNSTSIASTDTAITLGTGGGDDGSPSLAMSGATADINWTTAANIWISAIGENQYLVKKSVGGANITFSKGDDNANNMMASGYVQVS